jgi:hypothetical protein
MARETRKVTNKILDALADGTLSYQQVADAALIFMSEDDVAEMAHANEFFLHEQEEDDDDTDDESSDDDFFEDYNSVGSRHHY